MSGRRVCVAALAALAGLAAPATATEVRVQVANDAAPTVRIVSPADGARLPAGVEVDVRVESRDGDRLWMAVNGRRVWSVRTQVIQGAWAPEPGPSRIVAVAERDGAPDAVAVAEVTGVVAAAAPATPAAPAAPPAAGVPKTGTAPPGAAPSPPHPAAGLPGAAPSRPAARAPEPAPAALAPAAGPPAAGPVRAGAAPAGAEDDGGGGWVASLRDFLRDPERVAWSVGLPLLLMIAGGAYLLLQRFVDGGQKLAWRGRGRPDDQVVEF